MQSYKAPWTNRNKKAKKDVKDEVVDIAMYANTIMVSQSLAYIQTASAT